MTATGRREERFFLFLKIKTITACFICVNYDSINEGNLYCKNERNANILCG